jgi:DNA-binding PadR family transcriptional regulator
MISELKRHGYNISPGTLYPLLHKMEKENLLAKRVEIVEGKKRIYYSITRQGENLLKELRGKVKELFHEII